ncbi:hypothetical protein [Nocardioides sp.]|uniref:hypothetical protein n=1 Tax=Nocardioides sp. TaxID=35761 RepID=UPI0035276B9B
MSTDLHERLDELARRAPTGPPAADLWRRGRRRQARRVVAGAVAGLAVALATGIGGAALWARVDTSPQPAEPAPAEMRLPDRIFTPSPWLQGTDDLGPGGPYVALLGAERAGWDSLWTSVAPGVVGVGLDGSYRFLDLPGYVGDHGWSDQSQQLALSPDGRYVAYWTTGSTTGEPLLLDGSAQPSGGAAVYDTVTGAVSRIALTTEHGVAAEGAAWTGPVLRMGYGAFDTGGVGLDSWGSRTVGQLTWDARAGSWTEETDLRQTVDLTGMGAAGADALVITSGKRYTVVGADGPQLTTRIDAGFQTTPVPAPGGARLAGVWAPQSKELDGAAHSVLVADVAEGQPRTATQRVPGATAYDVLGWRGDDEVVLRQADGAVVGVDIGSGADEPLTTLPGTQTGAGLVVAADAWSAPVVTAVEPAWPMSTSTRQLLVTGGVALLLLLVVVAGRWRRGRA